MAAVRSITQIDDPRLVKALAHPLRVQILSALEKRTASPSELAEEFKVPLPNLSYHFRMLVSLELVELVKTKPRRGAIEHYYRAKGRVTLTDQAWDALPPTVANGMVGGQIKRLAEEALAAANVGRVEQLESLEVELDTSGWRAVQAAAKRFQADVRKAMKEGRNGNRARGTIAILGFEEPPPPDDAVTPGRVLGVVRGLERPTLAAVTRALNPDYDGQIGRGASPGREVAAVLDGLVDAGELAVVGSYRGGAVYGTSE